MDPCRAAKIMKTSGGMSNQLPDEIVEKIMSHLPVKSVLRFRAACRSWATLLSSSEFIDAHLANANARVMPKFLFFAPAATSYHATSVYSCSPSSTDSLFTIDNMRTNFLIPQAKTCRGLTLLFDSFSGAYCICNPSTRELIRLPQHRQDVFFSSAGLGFDSRTKECKVVNLFVDQEDCVGCEVYTLCAPGNCWGPAARGVPSHIRSVVHWVRIFEEEKKRMPPVFANGSFYWLLDPYYIFEHPESAILSFSIANEAFELIKSPSFMAAGEHMVNFQDHLMMGVDIAADNSINYVLYSGHDRYVVGPTQLAELDGCLCLIQDFRHFMQGSRRLEVWMLTDHSSSTWSLGFRINLTADIAKDLLKPRLVIPLCCINDHRLTAKKKLLLATSQHKVLVYDPMSETIETAISIASHRETVGTLRVGFYEESLTPVARTQVEIVPLSSPWAMAVKEILVRLPIRSIARAMLVCRQWAALIESESFAWSHLMHANKSKPPSIMVVINCHARVEYEHLDFMPLARWLEAASPSMLQHVEEKVVCSKPCNGFNLVSTKRTDFLCNPCIGFFRDMGSPPAASEPGDHQADHAFTVGKNIGLGFNRRTGDHVIVKLFYHRTILNYMTYVCWVWTTSAGGWRNIRNPPREVTDMPPAHVRGTLYWMSGLSIQQPNGEEWAIVAFDIAREAFKVLPCPPCNINWKSKTARHAFLVELSDNLCLVLANPETNEMDIWMRQSHDVWDIAYMIHLDGWPEYSPRNNVVIPMMIDPRDGRILLDTGRTLGYYDPKKQIMDRLCSLDQMHLLRSKEQQAMPPVGSVSAVLCDESLLRCRNPPRRTKRRDVF